MWFKNQRDHPLTMIEARHLRDKTASTKLEDFKETWYFKHLMKQIEKMARVGKSNSLWKDYKYCPVPYEVIYQTFSRELGYEVYQGPWGFCISID